MKSELSETARLLIRTAISQERKPADGQRARLLAAVRARALLPEAHFENAAQVAPWTGASPVVPLTVWKVAGVAAVGAGLGLATVGFGQIALDSSPHEHSTMHVAAPNAPATARATQPGLLPRLTRAPSAPRPLDASIRASEATPARMPQSTSRSSPRVEASVPRISPSRPREPQAGGEPSPSSPGDPALSAELSLLREVQGALRVGQAKRALELVARYEREFPNGQLRSERLAAEVFAACQLGDLPRARSAALRFLERDSLSPLALRVKGACALFAADGTVSHD